VFFTFPTGLAVIGLTGSGGLGPSGGYFLPCISAFSNPHDGRLENDSNQVENAIRPTAVGTKNWFFIGHAECGQRGAILFTIVQACRRLGINPFDYLKDVLTQIPTIPTRPSPHSPRKTGSKTARLRRPARPDHRRRSSRLRHLRLLHRRAVKGVLGVTLTK
jgi:hypothetical protein